VEFQFHVKFCFVGGTVISLFSILKIRENTQKPFKPAKDHSFPSFNVAWQFDDGFSFTAHF
jgi:hypothetical protein